jgi:hypothetical protein
VSRARPAALSGPCACAVRPGIMRVRGMCALHVHCAPPLCLPLFKCQPLCASATLQLSSLTTCANELRSAPSNASSPCVPGNRNKITKAAGEEYLQLKERQTEFERTVMFKFDHPCTRGGSSTRVGTALAM